MLKFLTILIFLTISISALAGRKYNQYKQPQHIFENTHGSLPAVNMIFEYLRVSTVDTGVEMAVDGDPTPVNFDYVMTDSDESILGAWITRINFTAINGGMAADTFFGLAVLSTGITIQVLDTDLSTVLLDFTAGIPIKAAIDFSILAGNDAQTINEVGATEDSSSIRWTLGKSGAPLFLLKGQALRVIIADDLTGITQFRGMVQGIK